MLQIGVLYQRICLGIAIFVGSSRRSSPWIPNAVWSRALSSGSLNPGQGLGQWLQFSKYGGHWPLVSSTISYCPHLPSDEALHLTGPHASSVTPDEGRLAPHLMPSTRPFLTAEWRQLAMLNYRVAPELLLPHVPAGTELDDWEGATYLSVVGFLFRDTRLRGVPVPFHRHFEEVNLRFYVRRRVGAEVRRGVTFLRELVPRRAIATVARLAYHEPYTALPMRHTLGPVNAATGAPAVVEYAWRHRGAWSRLAVEPVGGARALEAGSEEEFITEHYWGYTRQRDGGTVEYRVAHPPWRVWRVRSARLSGDLAVLYGADVAGALVAGPASAFLADGSAVTVHAPERLPLGDAAPSRTSPARREAAPDGRTLTRRTT